jgi:putative copper export protein
MEAFFALFVTPVLGGLLYVNLASQMKKIREGKKTTANTAWGFLLTAFLVFMIMVKIG